MHAFHYIVEFMSGNDATLHVQYFLDVGACVGALAVGATESIFLHESKVHKSARMPRLKINVNTGAATAISVYIIRTSERSRHDSVNEFDYE